MLPELMTVPIDTVKPYEGNPRRISDAAVEALKTSITEYGYVQPIVVDAQRVIVVGHTRYAALKALGRTDVQVYIASGLSPEKAAEYRLVDNRTGELTGWDQQALVVELREFEEGLLAEFFPDVNLEVALLNAELDMIGADDIEAAAREITKLPERPEQTMVRLSCPSCDYSFEVSESSLFGFVD